MAIPLYMYQRTSTWSITTSKRHGATALNQLGQQPPTTQSPSAPEPPLHENNQPRRKTRDCRYHAASYLATGSAPVMTTSADYNHPLPTGKTGSAPANSTFATPTTVGTNTHQRIPEKYQAPLLDQMPALPHDRHHYQQGSLTPRHGDRLNAQNNKARPTERHHTQCHRIDAHDSPISSYQTTKTPHQASGSMSGLWRNLPKSTPDASSSQKSTPRELSLPATKAGGDSRSMTSTSKP